MPNLCEELRERAKRFLAGQQLTFEDATELWKGLEKCDELSLARTVVRRMRGVKKALLHGLSQDARVLDKLCRQEALLTSKDRELRHGPSSPGAGGSGGEVRKPRRQEIRRRCGNVGNRRWYLQTAMGGPRSVRRPAECREELRPRGDGRARRRWIRSHQRSFSARSACGTR